MIALSESTRHKLTLLELSSPERLPPGRLLLDRQLEEVGNRGTPASRPARGLGASDTG